MRAVNLLAGERRGGGAGAGSQGAAPMLLVLIAGLAVMGGLYGLASRDLSSRRGEAARLDNSAQAVAARAAGLTSFTAFARLREERVQDVTELIDARFDWASALSELGRVLPSGATISALDGTIVAGAPSTSSTAGAAASSTPASSSPASASTTVTPATPVGSVPTFDLTGCALSQAEVAHTLERLRLIDGVQDVELQNSTRTTAGTSGVQQCPGGSPAFSATVTFDPLPDVPTPSGATLTTDSADRGGTETSGSTPNAGSGGSSTGGTGTGASR